MKMEPESLSDSAPPATPAASPTPSQTSPRSAPAVATTSQHVASSRSHSGQTHRSRPPVPNVLQTLPAPCHPGLSASCIPPSPESSPEMAPTPCRSLRCLGRPLRVAHVVPLVGASPLMAGSSANGQAVKILSRSQARQARSRRQPSSSPSWWCVIAIMEIGISRKIFHGDGRW
jgi:hypothetical protein